MLRTQTNDICSLSLAEQRWKATLKTKVHDPFSTRKFALKLRQGDVVRSVLTQDGTEASTECTFIDLSVMILPCLSFENHFMQHGEEKLCVEISQSNAAGGGRGCIGGIS
jgi:hypothetical protein